MAIGHVAVRPHSRAQGHSAAAAVAYRCGLALTCERTGERHDFTRRAQREDVAAYGLAGGHFESPAAFAAAVESAEQRRNSRICRDVQIALPIELDDPSRIELAEAFAAELAERYATAACWAVHRPDRRSDRRNHHAHILLPTRALAGDGCTFGKKLRVLDDQRRGPEEITEIRRLWESRANEALIAAGQDARVHTGRTTHPEPSLGAKHIAIERQAWQQRHTDFPNGLEQAGGLSAAQLVIDDGVCATRRGRALANHVTLRAFIAYSIGARELPRSRPVRPLVPEAAQAVVPVSPVEEPRPVRPPAPEAAQAVVPVSLVEEPRPVRPPAPEAAQAVVPVSPVEDPRPVRPPAPEAAQAVVPVSPVEDPRPVRPPAPEAAQAVVPVSPVEDPRPVRPPAPEAAQAVVPVSPVEEPRPVRPPAPEAAQTVVPVSLVEEPRPVRILIRAIIERLQALKARRRTLKAASDRERQRREQDLQAARQWLTRTVGPSRHGINIRDVADSIARQRLTANVSLSKYHPERHSERPTLPEAISQLEPCAAPGYHGNRFGDIPDRWNTGACRTRKGAEQAAQVLDQAIDNIARKHFDGHTDPRDYKPGFFSFKPLISEAKEDALNEWQEIREKIIERMITAAEGPEAIEIRRQKHEQERKARAKEERERIARERRAEITAVPKPQDPNQNTGPDRDGPGF